MADQSEGIDPEGLSDLATQPQSDAGGADANTESIHGSRADASVTAGDMEVLFNQAERALASIQQGGEEELPAGAAAFKFEEFTGTPASTREATLDLVRDVEMDLTIELGRTHMYLEDLLRLRKGAVVPLDKLAGDPVDIYVNGRLIARGEVLVLNDNFCVRVAELVAGEGPHAERHSA
jgi:flagellar motor switch protein FliN/FliY